MKNVKELRNTIIASMDSINNGTVDLKAASELNKASNTIMKTIALQMQYSKSRKEKPQIDFMKCR